ncbi:MAG: type II secretion system F family protein [Anderseniella sp.]|nr:type II secretion system F family protein [Anderseniella sp.]
MHYNYQAVNRQGETVSGDIEADGERAAARMLRQMELMPTVIRTGSAAVSRPAQRSRRGVKRAELALIVRELATLLRAGVPLAESVESLAQAHGQDSMGVGLDRIYMQLRAGASFSASLAECGLPWPEYFRPLVTAGEQTGKLALALDSAAEQMEHEERVNREIRNALIYPAILVFSGIAATLLIFVIVVPKFANLLRSGKGNIPQISVWVLETGMFVQEHLLLFGLGGIALILAAWATLSNPRMRTRILDQLSVMPMVGRWILETELGRWAAMLSTLLANRVPILASFALAEQGLRLASVRNKLQRVVREIRAGKKIADTMQTTGLLGLTQVNLIRVGERSGELAMTLRSVATLYENASRERLKRFLILLEPIAILLIGSVIGFIMIAIMLAITSLSDINI